MKVAIVFYSMYSHTYKMAVAVKQGIDSVPGCQGDLLQVAETLPAEVLEKMGAPPKPDVPVCDPSTLNQYDGFIFGIPTRFGMMAGQMKAMFDATGALWQAGELSGKPAGIFVSTGTQCGGQETTALTAITQLAHHGMIFVPVGYTFGGALLNMDDVRGGSPYGAGCLAGADGSRPPSETEIDHATHQGKLFAGIAKKIAVVPAKAANGAAAAATEKKAAAPAAAKDQKACGCCTIS